jgi:predicted nucleotidyltransferase
MTGMELHGESDIELNRLSCYINKRKAVSRLAKYTRKVYTLPEIKDIIAPIAKSYGVTKVSVFGSYARGEAIWKSDIDFKVDDGGNIKTLFQLGGLFTDLEEAFRKPVDVVTVDAMSVEFANAIKGDEVVVYG